MDLSVDYIITWLPRMQYRQVRRQFKHIELLENRCFDNFGKLQCVSVRQLRLAAQQRSPSSHMWPCTNSLCYYAIYQLLAKLNIYLKF
ncbi:hypothetical protein FGO68_gene4986 [Halteria grandinella]|uniref:Uncharacterized protein n=1 Tax=Halteria grandinella TaxID=5974 RepID=A0A8J8STT3_HALGN|nr:hypothetical protein FGO68_gene4986 [Halteria grandinella]